MGYWGFNPMDGDGPHDLFDELDAPANKILAKYLKGARNSDEKWEAIGLAQLIFEADINISKKNLEKTIALINDVTNDYDFLDNWQDPKQARLGANKFLGDLTKEYKQIHGFRQK